MQPHTAAQVLLTHHIDYLERSNPNGFHHGSFEFSVNIYNAEKKINKIKYYKLHSRKVKERLILTDISGFRECDARVLRTVDGYHEIQHGCYREVRENYRLISGRVSGGRTVGSLRHGPFHGEAVHEKQMVLYDTKTRSKYTIKIESMHISFPKAKVEPVAAEAELVGEGTEVRMDQEQNVAGEDSGYTPGEAESEAPLNAFVAQLMSYLFFGAIAVFVLLLVIGVIWLKSTMGFNQTP